MFSFLLNVRITALSATSDALYKKASQLWKQGRQLTKQSAKEYESANDALQSSGRHKSYDVRMVMRADMRMHVQACVWPYRET